MSFRLGRGEPGRRRHPGMLVPAAAVGLVVPLLAAAPAGARQAAAAGPAIHLPQDQGHPSGVYDIRGSGFGSRDAISVRLGAVRVGSATATRGGSFATTFRVPAAALPGVHKLTVAGSPSGRRAGADFTVRTNWDQFKFAGSHVGVNPYENVLSRANVAGLRVAWAVQTGAPLDLGSPVVFDGRVYVANSAGTVLALRESDGAVIWRAQAGTGFRSAPAIYRNHVYVSGDRETFCFRLADGKLLWTAEAGNASASPVPANGIVYVGGGPLTALNADTGATVWAFSAEDEFHGSPTVAGGVVTAGSIDYHTYELSARTGALIWRVRPAEGGQDSDEVFGATAQAGGRVFVGELLGRLFALNQATGATLWAARTGGGITFSSPTVTGNLVIVGSDTLYAFSAGTGARVWTAAITPGSFVDSAAAVANGVVYAGASDGRVYAFSTATGARLWSAATGGPVLSSPAVTDGTVFIGSEDGKIYAYRLGQPGGRAAGRAGAGQR